MKWIPIGVGFIYLKKRMVIIKTNLNTKESKNEDTNDV